MLSSQIQWIYHKLWEPYVFEEQVPVVMHILDRLPCLHSLVLPQLVTHFRVKRIEEFPHAKRVEVFLEEWFASQWTKELHAQVEKASCTKEEHAKWLVLLSWADVSLDLRELVLPKAVERLLTDSYWLAHTTPRLLSSLFGTHSQQRSKSQMRNLIHCIFRTEWNRLCEPLQKELSKKKPHSSSNKTPYIPVLPILVVLVWSAAHAWILQQYEDWPLETLVMVGSSYAIGLLLTWQWWQWNARRISSRSVSHPKSSSSSSSSSSADVHRTSSSSSSSSSTASGNPSAATDVQRESSSSEPEQVLARVLWLETGMNLLVLNLILNPLPIVERWKSLPICPESFQTLLSWVHTQK